MNEEMKETVQRYLDGEITEGELANFVVTEYLVEQAQARK